MKLYSWEIFKALFNPTFTKIVLFALAVGIVLRIIKILFDRKMKTIKPVKLKTSTLIVIALVSVATAYFLLRN